MLCCASSFVTAAYAKYASFLMIRAPCLRLFTSPSIIVTNYFFSSSSFLAGALAASFSPPFMDFLKFLIPFPSAEPISGNLPTPKIIIMITNTIKSSGTPIPNIFHLFDTFYGSCKWTTSPDLPIFSTTFPLNCTFIPPAFPISIPTAEPLR